MNNFHYSLTLADQLYGVTMQEEQFEELALYAWNHIGNKRYKLYKFSTCINECNQKITLPCNCDSVESVTTSGEDWNRTSYLYPEGDINSAMIEEYIESRKDFKHPLYQRGKFVKYINQGDSLVFPEPCGQVTIVYKGVEYDEDGLPSIDDKEALAIATYCAYVTKFKEGIVTNNANIINVANVLKQQWATQCDQARITSLNQNDMDQILDVKFCWDRKQYGKSYKPLK